MLLENPKGDNRLDLVKLKSVITSIFGVKNAKLSVYHGETGMWRAEDILSFALGGLVTVFVWCLLFGRVGVFS